MDTHVLRSYLCLKEVSISFNIFLAFVNFRQSLLEALSQYYSVIFNKIDKAYAFYSFPPLVKL